MLTLSKRLRWLKRTRRPFDIGTVLELTRSTDLECEKVPHIAQPKFRSGVTPFAGFATH